MRSTNLAWVLTLALLAARCSAATRVEVGPTEAPVYSGQAGPAAAVRLAPARISLQAPGLGSQQTLPQVQVRPQAALAPVAGLPQLTPLAAPAAPQVQTEQAESGRALTPKAFAAQQTAGSPGPALAPQAEATPQNRSDLEFLTVSGRKQFDNAAQPAASAEIPASQQAIVDLARKIAPVFHAWVMAPSQEARQKASREFLAIDKELSRAESEEGRRRNLLKKQGQTVTQNETVQGALKEWHNQGWLIRQFASSSEWSRLLDWPLEPGRKKAALLNLAQGYGFGGEKGAALWLLVEKFNPHGPTDAALRQSLEDLSARTNFALEAWRNASGPGERLKMQASLKAVNDELDRVQGDELGRRSLLEGKNLEYNDEDPAIRASQSARHARNHLVEQTDEPDSTFNRLLELPLGPNERKEAVKKSAKDERLAPDVVAALVDLVKDFKGSGPSNSAASMEQLYQGERWKRRLSSPLSGQSYVGNFRATLPNSWSSQYYALQAAQARARGEMIETGGRQSTRRQSRGTCPFNATCNLFADQIAESKLTSKDILREAYRLNPTFASRPGNGVEAINGLSQEHIIEMSNSLATRVGKKVAAVEPVDLIKFMAAKKKPVMATIHSWDEVRHTPFDHVVVLGNPFVFHRGNGERSVAFEVYDSNLPAGAVTYIDAETLDGAMGEDGLALLDGR